MPLYGTGERGLRQCKYQRYLLTGKHRPLEGCFCRSERVERVRSTQLRGYPNTDWFDEVFDTGYSQEHNLSVAGSSEKVKYMLSLGYLDNQGVMNRWNLDSSTQKINFRTNLEAKIVKWMTVGTRLYGQKQDYGMANISNGFKYLYQTTPGVYPGEPNYWGRAALASEESSNANNIFGQMAGATGFNTVCVSTLRSMELSLPIKAQH